MNIVAIGTSDDEIAHAIRAVEAMQGGFAAVSEGRVLADVPLPIGGLMSDASWEETARLLAAAHVAAEGMGCTLRAPYMVLSFVGFMVVPDFGVTELGFIDVAAQEFAPLVLESDDGIRLPCRCITHDHPVHALADRLTQN